MENSLHLEPRRRTDGTSCFMEDSEHEKIHANLRKNALQTLRVFAWIVRAWFDMFFHPRSASSKTNGFNFI